MKQGDKVICIDDNNWYPIPVKKICAGIIYTLSDVFTCRCGNVYVSLAEIRMNHNMWCPGCNTFSYGNMFYHIERFRPLEETENSGKISCSSDALIEQR